MRRLIVGVLLAASSLRPQPAIAQGLAPLTEASLAEAKAAKDEPAFDSPTIVKLRNIYPHTRPPTREELTESQRVLARIEASPFTFTIISPYARAYAISKEAARKFEEPKLPTIAALNTGLIEFHVGPASSILKLDTIENVVIKRGDAVIRPTKVAVTPTVVQTAAGMKKETAEGSFTFDYAAFEPSEAITIVLIGKAGNFEWTMTADELSKLK